MKKRVLLVDDSSLVLDLVAEALAAAGFSPSLARDPAELDRAVAGEPPDLVLMDVQMPEAFGDDLAYVLRCARGVGAPIYLFSALDDDELRARAAAIEIEGFISKRIGIDRIVARVREILEA